MRLKWASRGAGDSANSLGRQACSYHDIRDPVSFQYAHHKSGEKPRNMILLRTSWAVGCVTARQMLMEGLLGGASG
jgi:hypothetical protein